MLHMQLIVLGLQYNVLLSLIAHIQYVQYLHMSYKTKSDVDALPFHQDVESTQMLSKAGLKPGYWATYLQNDDF